MIKPKNLSQEDYIQRINQVFLYIETHLDEDLSLNLISERACFSPFHFHRIFKTIVGETLNEYVNRKRLEHAANRLMHHEEVSIAQITVDYGFSSNATFSRAFKKKFNVSPTEFQKEHFSKNMVNKELSKNSKIIPDYDQYICTIINLKKWIDMSTNIEIKTMPEMNLAYITAMGIKEMKGAFGRLMQWAGPKGMLANPNMKMATVYHDSFKTTAPEKVQMSAAILLDQPVKPDGEVHTRTIAEEKCIVGRFEIKVEEFEKAWTGMFLWMNENGYEKSNSNPYEIYYNDFMTHPEQKFILDICIPIV
jgi:AraC family transcriptional regulator